MHIIKLVDSTGHRQRQTPIFDNFLSISFSFSTPIYYLEKENPKLPLGWVVCILQVNMWKLNEIVNRSYCVLFKDRQGWSYLSYNNSFIHSFILFLFLSSCFCFCSLLSFLLKSWSPGLSFAFKASIPSFLLVMTYAERNKDDWLILWNPMTQWTNNQPTMSFQIQETFGMYGGGFLFCLMGFTFIDSF